MVGGVLGPLGTMVPWGDSPKEGRAAHGLLHPAVRIPWELVDVYDRLFLLALQVVVCYKLSFCFSQGLGCCLAL